jgi:hypothetical protein
VPRYQHVFLFYFENEDFGSVIGNTRQAPYLNRLLPGASLLASFYAEEHPSDGNYLALAGGSTFGIPLNDPLEENPGYTIAARNIGDLANAAHETWKGYLQRWPSAVTPAPSPWSIPGRGARWPGSGPAGTRLPSPLDIERLSPRLAPERARTRGQTGAAAGRPRARRGRTRRGEGAAVQENYPPPRPSSCCRAGS